MTQTLSPPLPPSHEDSADRAEHRWAAVAVGVVTLLVVVAAVAGLRQEAMPQSRLETVELRTLHLGGEFVESNLGSAIEPDGAVTVRAIGQQFSFTPSCILVPTATPVTFRITSSDVVHGFLIMGTDINLMLVPGYISKITAHFQTPGESYMPCHEFCGMGHEGMWGRIKVVDKDAFKQMAASTRRLSCAK